MNCAVKSESFSNGITEMTIPTLADGQPTKYTYQAGDRILARVSFQPTREQEFRLVRQIRKYTREDVRILLVNCSLIGILWERADGTISALVSRKDIKIAENHISRVDLDCSVTNLQPGDRLFVMTPPLKSELERSQYQAWIQEWSGKDVEVIIQDRG